MCKDRRCSDIPRFLKDIAISNFWFSRIEFLVYFDFLQMNIHCPDDLCIHKPKHSLGKKTQGTIFYCFDGRRSPSRHTYSKFPEVEHVLERIATLNSALTQVRRGTETNILL